MKKIVRYQCEICKREFNSEQAALDCEADGLPPKYPIGCIYGDHEPGNFYEGITFAVASNRTMKYSHANYGGSWACRDTGYLGDTLGEQKCGSGTLRLEKWHSNLDPEQPSFKRMVTYLKTLNLPLIYVWNGKKPVPLEEWLNEKTA